MSETALDFRKPIKGAPNNIPIKYPAVGPVNPPKFEAKTGKPAAPIKIQLKTAQNDSRGESNNPKK